MKQYEDANGESAQALKCDLAGEVLRSFGPVCFPAVGWSMLPAVWPGDTLVVERVTHDQVDIGDVVVAGRHGRLCAHRVIAKSGDPENPRWITQGDALPAPDRPVTRNELMGRVAYLIRAGRCIAVPAELSVAGHLMAKILRRSVPAARALAYLHRMVQSPETPSAEKSDLPCQG
jgi:signal peptidase I